MSDDYLKIMPTSPNHVPPEGTHQRALKLLKSLFPEAEDLQAEIYHEGDNFEVFNCPSCKKRLIIPHSPIDDPIAAWWWDLADLMEDAAETSVTTKMPCCGQVARLQVTQLMAIEFEWPVGFARFELNVMNPNVGVSLTKAQLEELEEILGCPLEQMRVTVDQ